MRKLVLILLVSIAVATFIRAYDYVGGSSVESTDFELNPVLVK